MKKREFSPEELADILRRRAAGETVKSIGASYGCCGVVITRAISVAGAAAGSPAPEMLAAIHELTAAVELLAYAISEREPRRAEPDPLADDPLFA